MAIVPIGLLFEVELKVPNRMMGSPHPGFEHHNYWVHLLEVIFSLSRFIGIQLR